MTKRVFSTLFWAFVAGSSIVLYPVAVMIWLLTVAFDRRLVVLHRFTCFWASLYTWFNPVWPVTLEGRDKIRPGTTYVMVANHLSLLDILVLFRLFRHFKWVSKIENFKVPLIGWNMSMNRYIKLRRGDRENPLTPPAQGLAQALQPLGQPPDRPHLAHPRRPDTPPQQYRHHTPPGS